MTKLKTIPTVLLFGMHIILIASVSVIILKHDNGQMREYLKGVIPVFLEVNFFLIIIAFLLNLSLIKKIIKSIPKKIWITAFIIAVSGLIITMFVAPRTHRIFFDEDIYVHIGQNIAYLNQAGFCNNGGNEYGKYYCNEIYYNKEPYGWPFLISILFRLVGESYFSCFLLNNFIWMSSILLVFLLGAILFENMTAGLFGALIFACIPESLLWSNTVASEPSAMFMGGLAVFSILLFSRNPSDKTLFLCAVFLPFAVQFRPESIMILLPVFLTVCLYSPGELIKKKTFCFLILFMFLIAPHIIHLISIRSEDWGAISGPKFSFDFFKDNLWTNALFYIENDKFPVVFTLFFFMGIVLPLENLKQTGDINRRRINFHWKAKIIALIWFILFWGIFLFFYAGSYKYGTDVRFSLVSYMPIALLAGYGAAAVCRILNENTKFKHSAVAACIFILFCFTGFLPHVRAVTLEGWSARADHAFAEEISKKLPFNSIVLTYNPNMFLVWGNNAAQAAFAIYHPEFIDYCFKRYTGGVFFYFNCWCNIKDTSQSLLCKEILNKYHTKRIMAHQENDATYILYSLEYLKEPKNTKK